MPTLADKLKQIQKLEDALNQQFENVKKLKKSVVLQELLPEIFMAGPVRTRLVGRHGEGMRLIITDGNGEEFSLRAEDTDRLKKNEDGLDILETIQEIFEK